MFGGPRNWRDLCSKQIYAMLIVFKCWVKSKSQRPHGITYRRRTSFWSYTMFTWKLTEPKGHPRPFVVRVPCVRKIPVWKHNIESLIIRRIVFAHRCLFVRERQSILYGQHSIFSILHAISFVFFLSQRRNSIKCFFQLTMTSQDW